MTDDPSQTKNPSEKPLHYQTGLLSVTELNEAIEQLWAEARASGELADQEEVPPITARSAEAGFEPFTVAIVVTGYVAKDVWKEIILPRLKDRWGPEAIGHEVEEHASGD
jgi:hypothetical protein